MADDRVHVRRYTEQEVSLILQQAAEAQLRAPERGSGVAAREGMSLAELEAIAAEAGLDVEQVRRAATELTTRPAAASGFVGAPTRMSVEREVPGELPASAHDLVTDAIRRHTGTGLDGEVTIAGRSLHWTLEGLSGWTTVSVSTRAGRTLVHVDRGLTGYAAALFVLLGVGGGITGGSSALALALGTAMTGLAATGVGAAVLGGSYLLGRGIYRRKAEAIEREIHLLADVVAASVAEAIEAEREAR